MADTLHQNSTLERPQHQLGEYSSIMVAGGEASHADSEVVTDWESQHFVKEAPRFEDQLKDWTRTTLFQAASNGQKSYKQVNADPAISIERSTEIEGLRQLNGFLTGFIKYKEQWHEPGKEPSPTVAKAMDMLENMTFIGEQEFREAASAIGLTWKAYLDADPARKLCVWTITDNLGETDYQKSGGYLRNKILETFSDQDLERYSGRLVSEPEDLDADPDNAKIVLLDDWVLSGRQMRTAFGKLSHESGTFYRFFKAGSVEMNLITASRDRIENGLLIDPAKDDGDTIPVKAYFMAHHAETAHPAHNSYISGMHSVANYGFAESCRIIAGRFPEGEVHDDGTPMNRRKVPAIVRLVPDYRYDVPSVEITKHELRRLSREELEQKRVARLAELAGVLLTSNGAEVS